MACMLIPRPSGVIGVCVSLFAPRFAKPSAPQNQSTVPAFGEDDRPFGCRVDYAIHAER